MHNFIVGLSFLLLACETPPEKMNRSYQVDFTATTTTSVEFKMDSPIAWGGLVMFRTIRMEGKNEKRVELSVTDPTGYVIRVSEITPHTVCTLKIPKCVWTFPTTGWKTEDGKSPNYITIVLLPYGDKLEHAGVIIIADGIHRITTLLVWESPPMSDGVNLIADANWKKDSS